MKKSSMLAASAAALLAVAPAQAAVTFTLEGITFSDGTSAKGSFTTNDDYSAVTDFAVSTQAGSLYLFGIPEFPVPIGGFDFSPKMASASISGTGVSFVETDAFLFSRVLSLDFDTLTAGSTKVGGFEALFIFGREITGGQIVSSLAPGGPGSGGPVPGGAVPEPATWAMMIGGIGAIGAALRRRRQVRTTVRFA